MGQLRDIVSTFAPSVVGKDAAAKSDSKAKVVEKEESKVEAKSGPKAETKPEAKEEPQDDGPETEAMEAVKDSDKN